MKLTPETPRDRRLEESGDARQPGEEERLLQNAGPHLRDLIIAGIATGCRVGELLGLQWKDVKVRTGRNGQAKRFLALPAGKTKTSKAREVPVGSRLGAVLDMRRHAPDGRLLGPEAYVFGNAVGERVGCVKKAWQTAVLKAHGHAPQWVKGKNTQSGAACFGSVRIGRSGEPLGSYVCGWEAGIRSPIPWSRERITNVDALRSASVDSRFVR